MELNEECRTMDFEPSRFMNRRWNYDELLVELPETNVPIELWDGEFVMSPSPNFFHQELIARFFEVLRDWVKPRKLGKVILSPMDMILTQRNVTQPDVLFIAKDRLAIIRDRVRGAADLAMEVISEGSRRKDRIEKRELYQRHGIKEYWIIDPKERTVEVLYLDRDKYHLVGCFREGETARSRFLDGFAVNVNNLFAPTGLENQN